MCKLGDIIVIKEFKNEFGKKIKRHSFVVINDEGDNIQGLKYDFVSNMLCSFHDESHRKRKLIFKSNYEIVEDAILTTKGNKKAGFIKADQLYYFDKTKINYYVVGELNPKMLNELFKLIIILMEQRKVTKVITNLKGN